LARGPQILFQPRGIEDRIDRCSIVVVEFTAMKLNAVDVRGCQPTG
jgi:hypothetical protein